MLEYEKAFSTRREDGASENKILAEDSFLIMSVDHLIQQGVLVGQAQMIEEDTIYFLNPERDNTPPEFHSEWNIPNAMNPLERLKRPVVTTGVTRTV